MTTNLLVRDLVRLASDLGELADNDDVDETLAAALWGLTRTAVRCIAVASGESPRTVLDELWKRAE